MADIPKSLRDIEQAIGTSKVLELIRELGGQKIYVPVALSPSWSLLPVLGIDGAQKLIDICGGNQVEIPKGTNHKRETRNNAIRSDHIFGLSLGEITKKYDLSRRQVQKILNGK
jgi:Mor family transcriptional regulator